MLLERMLRAIFLDPAVYEDLRRDRSATGQAITVVFIVAACSLIGARMLGPVVMLEAGIGAFINWLFVSMIVMLVANRFGGRVEFDEIIRPLAFAQTPGVLYVLALVPGWGSALPLPLVVWLWSTVALFVAIREVIRLETREAALTVLFTTLILAVFCLVTGWTCGATGTLAAWLRAWIGGR
jgi:hypothetical protein